MDQRGLRPEDFRSASDLRKLPLVDKVTVQDNLDQFQPRALDPASCLVLKSSRGGAMIWTAGPARRGLAIAERERAVWLPLAGRRLGCRQLHILSPASSTVEVRSFWDRLVVTPKFVSQKFFADPFRSYEEIIATLDDLRPDIAFSFGSYAEHFFRFLADSGISPALPRAWYCGADALAPPWRKIVQERFGVEVYSNYAATETGRIGFECERRNGYHLNIDFTAVRLVDEGGQDVPAGEVGEVIVSNLHNTATVLLNYRLGDLAELSVIDCPCGRNLPLLRELHGRVLESILLANGRDHLGGLLDAVPRHPLRSPESADRGPGAGPYLLENCPRPRDRAPGVREATSGTLRPRVRLATGGERGVRRRHPHGVEREVRGGESQPSREARDLMGTPAPADWEAIGRQLETFPARSLWRTYCDALNRRWLEKQLRGEKFDAAVKTDAFDEAVGDGVYPVLQKVAGRLYAMDVSASTCRLAAGRCSGLLPVACDVRKLPFDEDLFDLVVSLSTLDHFTSISEMEAALRCLHRVLRPGGRLLITLDNLSNPLVWLRNSLPPRILQKVGLVPFPVGATLHPGQLRALLEKVGFEVQDLTTLMHVPRAPVVALAALLDRLDESFFRSLCCRAWLSLELLSQLPTSRWTGNYVAASCSKGSSTPPSK